MRQRNHTSGSKREKDHGIELLLKGSLETHCNTLVGYSRIPNKYDHFHDRTYVSTSSRPKRLLSLFPKNINFLKVEEFFNFRQPLLIQFRRTPLPRTPMPKY